MNPSCPFCGIELNETLAGSTPILIAHPIDLTCPLSTYGFTREQWQRRPPERSVPMYHIDTTSTVEPDSTVYENYIDDLRTILFHHLGIKE